ncbi:hypothetical protein EDD16DRAFT_1707495 [Pisolithus croceorrhizus]|nr:hypothetical protein EDD16DRAFT_1707495 [Pisolithus croceorrhizus]
MGNYSHGVGTPSLTSYDRLRVRSQLTNLQRSLAEEVLSPESTASLELQLSALVIAFAILNPYVTEWDIDRFSEPMKNVTDKAKYFPYPQWGQISDPATVLDVHHRVLAWYLPGIMPLARVEHLNKIHLPLKDSLADGSEIFGHGRLMNSPATFQQAHTRLEDGVYQSSSLRKGVVRQWLQDISYAEEFWNKIAEVVLPDLAQVGKDAISVKGD